MSLNFPAGDIDDKTFVLLSVGRYGSIPELFVIASLDTVETA